MKKKLDTGRRPGQAHSEPRAESREPRAESREPRAESREPRAESREPRAESREPRAYGFVMAAMPRLSAPSRRDCSPDSALAARSRRGGVPSLHRCIAAVRRRGAMALLFVLAAVALAAPAQAQTSVELVSNFSETESSAGGLNSFDQAQAFTTGTNTGGYKLTSISLDLSGQGGGGGSIAVSIHSDSSGNPGTSLGTLGTHTASGGVRTFSSTTGIDLAASRTYFVVVDVTGLLRSSVSNTSSDNESSTVGWTIANGSVYRSKDLTSGAWTDFADSKRIRINGYAKTGGTDTTAPAFASAAANGASLVITFDEDLAAAASLANSAFTVKKTASGGSEATVALSTTVAPVISGTTVTLTLDTALVSTDGSVKVTYTKPATGSANKLVDAASNETATFTDQTVTNNSNTAPEFANDTATRSFTETVGDATVTTAEDLGSPITATDSDGDTLTYTLGGSDAVKFDLDASSGQLATKVGESYDREAKASYSVTVTATDPDTDSDSVAVTINVDNATELPLVPSGLSAVTSTIHGANVDVAWTAPINAGRPVLLTYDVQYRTGADDWASQSVPANKTFVTLTGLTAETSYDFQVRAVNLDGDGPWSDSVTLRTAPAPTVPAAPTSFTATAGDGAVMLAWETVSDAGGSAIIEYQYRHAAGTTVPGSTNWNTVPDSGDSGTDLYDERSFTVTSLTNGTEYAFELRAVNAVGGGTKASPVTATPIAPPLVSNIEQSVNNNSSAVLGTTAGSSHDLHQAFTTGAVGARLTSITIKLSALIENQPLPTMTLHKGSATSAAIATLSTTGTASGFNANYTYTAPANTILAASTTYYVVVQGGSVNSYARATDSDSEDSGSETGWSVADGYGKRAAASTGDFTIDFKALMIRVDGTVASENTAATGTPTIC